MNLGKVIKILRKEKDITQNQLAEILDLKRSTIAGYETERKQPDIDTLIRTADFFDVSLDYLTGRTDDRIYEYNHGSIDTELSNLINEITIRKELQYCIRNLSSLAPAKYNKVINIINILTTETHI